MNNVTEFLHRDYRKRPLFWPARAAARILVMVCGIAGGLWPCAACCLAANELPETIELNLLAKLYEPVILDHVLHADMYDCSLCHHHTAAAETQNEFCSRCHKTAIDVADIRCAACHADSYRSTDKDNKKGRYHIDVPSLKGAMHLLCRNCHLQESGPAECLDCHAYSAEGRKRFLVKD